MDSQSTCRILGMIQKLDRGNEVSNQLASIAQQNKCVFDNEWKGIRYLRLVRSDGKDIYTHVHRLNAYALNKRHTAVNGRVEPQHHHFGWQLADNEDDVQHEHNFAHTEPSKNATIELDFGEAGVNCRYFVVVHRSGYDDRMIGTRFEAVNVHNQVVFSYDFKDTSIRRALFEFPSRTPVVLTGQSPIRS